MSLASQSLCETIVLKRRIEVLSFPLKSRQKVMRMCQNMQFSLNMSQCLAVSCLILYIAAALKHKLRATCTSSEWIRAIHMIGKRLGVRIPKDNQQPCFSNLYVLVCREKGGLQSVCCSAGKVQRTDHNRPEDE